jgi:pyroglutamyl-peptidase
MIHPPSMPHIHSFDARISEVSVASSGASSAGPQAERLSTARAKRIELVVRITDFRITNSVSPRLRRPAKTRLVKEGESGGAVQSCARHRSSGVRSFRNLRGYRAEDQDVRGVDRAEQTRVLILDLSASASTPARSMEPPDLPPALHRSGGLLLPGLRLRVPRAMNEAARGTLLGLVAGGLAGGISIVLPGLAGLPDRGAPIEEPFTILVSGFEPFGARSVNLSGQVVERLDGAFEDGSLRVETIVLPVEYRTAAELLLARIEALDPDLVLEMGEKSLPNALIELEGRAFNGGTGGPDNAGVQQRDEAIPNAPASLDSKVDVEGVEARLDEILGEGDQVIATRDITRYVCNDLYFRTMEELRADDVTVLFAHLPRNNPDEVTHAVKELIELLASRSELG